MGKVAPPASVPAEGWVWTTDMADVARVTEAASAPWDRNMVVFRPVDPAVKAQGGIRRDGRQFVYHQQFFADEATARQGLVAKTARQLDDVLMQLRVLEGQAAELRERLAQLREKENA